ncbi:MAG: hypothetical protein QOK39_1990 [Acidimicrobiaceae bacterium]|jgi:hypothetical protein|nr:hypothetical protein [Acidimicrobiaceae bacterium]
MLGYEGHSYFPPGHAPDGGGRNVPNGGGRTGDTIAFPVPFDEAV